MPFTLVQPRKLDMSEVNPYAGGFGEAINTYQNILKSAFLKPGLEEALKKAQLYNQYYGPSMESQMGLQGAQTANYGALTTAQNYKNQYLPQQLKDEAKARQLKAMQDAMFVQMLKQRMQPQQSGAANSFPNPVPAQYTPGMGEAPYSMEQEQTQPSPAPSFLPQQQPSMQQNQPDFNQVPQLSNDDIVNKKFFGVDTFSPKYKAYIDAISKNLSAKQAEQFKLDSKESLADFKETSAAQKDLPVLNDALKTANRIRDIIQARPSFFGHYWFPERFAKRATDPLAGEFTARLVPIITELESKLSNRGNQLALKKASEKVPDFADTQQSALGKMNAIISSLTSQINNTMELAGGNIVRRGNKRFINKNGKWYEVSKDHK